MLKNKQQVDRHVSHLLSRCSSANERKALGLNIAILYIDVNEFKVAKGYLERYLQVNKASTDAVRLLTWVNEAMHRPCEPSEPSLFRSTETDKNVTDQLDISESYLFAETLDVGERYSPDRLNIIKAQLLRDPTNSDACIWLIKAYLSLNLSKEAIDHCINCLNAGYHYDSASWFHCFIDLMESSADNTELHKLLSVLGHMMLIRLTSSTSCLSDLRTRLEHLSRTLRSLTSAPESSFLQKEGEAWLYFYSAVYSQRRFRDLDDGSYCEGALHQFYLRAVERMEASSRPCGTLLPAIWKHLHHCRQEHRVQAMWLLHRYPSTAPENFYLNSLSWCDLLDLVHGVMKENKLVQSEQLKESNQSTKGVGEDLLLNNLSQISCDALLMNPENLSLVIWLCAQHSGKPSELQDQTLSNERIEFICKFVSACFGSLDVSNLPLPFTESQSTLLVPVDTMCQLDLICFLLATFLQAAVRSLSGNPGTISAIGIHWLNSPVCLIPNALQPTIAQKQWWATCLKVALSNTPQETARPTRTPSILHCGLSQLRLVTRPARCFGRQSGLFPNPLLFRVAHALTLLADKASGTERKRLIEDWAAGYWQAALQYQAFGTPPPLHTNALGKIRAFPACSGTSNVLSEKSQFSSPASPRYSISAMDSPGSQQAHHVLFTLPSDCDWWSGVQTLDSSIKVEWRWFNFGVCYLLTQLNQRSKETEYLSGDGKAVLRRLIRLLDKEDVHLSREAYHLGGQLLMNCTPVNRITSSDEPNPHMENVSNSVLGDPLANTRRARYYMERASKSPLSTSDVTDHQFPTAWHTPQFVDKSTPFRIRPSTWADSISTSLIVNRSSSPSNVMLESCLNDTVESLNVHLPRTPYSVTDRVADRPSDTGVKDTPNRPGAANGELTDELGYMQCDRSQEMLMSSFLNSWQSLVTGLSCQLAETKAELSRSRQLNEQLSTQLNDTSKQLSEAMNKFVACQEKLHNQTNQPAPLNTTPDNVTDALRLLQSPIRDLCLAITDLRRWLPEGMAAAATAAVNAYFQSQLPTSRAMFNSAEAAALMQFYGPNGPFAAFNQLPMQSIPVNWRAPVFHPASNNPVPVPTEFKPRAYSGGTIPATVTSAVPQTGVCVSDFAPHQLEQTTGLPRQPNSLVASNSLFPESSAPSAWGTSQSPRRDTVAKPPGRLDLTDNSLLSTSAIAPTQPTTTVYPSGQLTIGSDYPRQFPKDPNTSVSLPTYNSRPLLGSDTGTPNYLSSNQPVVADTRPEPKPFPNLGLFQPSTFGATDTSRSASTEVKGNLTSTVTPEKPANTSLFGLEHLNLSGSTPTNVSLSSSLNPFGHSSPQTTQTDTTKSPATSRTNEDYDQCPEAYEPKVDFKPVVSSLPDLVEQYTGEEDEERLFSDRARLFRFDKPTGSWKTRGVGEVRVLRNTKSDKYRLLMRRDQVKKLCANHAISGNLHVTISTKDERMAMWAVRDYSECSEGKDETFMIQFKSAELLQQFMNVVQECVAKCSGSNTSTPSKTTSKPETTTTAPGARVKETPKLGASDLLTKFGPKPGEWNCSVCMVRNTADSNKCAACQTAKPTALGGVARSEPAPVKDSLLLKFAPQPGSWDCPTCMLHHDSTVQTCPACNTAKPGGTSSSSSKPPSTTQLFGGFTMGGGGFVFGQQKPNSSTTDTAAVTPSKPLFSFVGSASKPTALFTPSPPQSSTATKSTSSTTSQAIDTKPLSSTLTKPSVFFFGKDPTPAVSTTGTLGEPEKTDKTGGAFASLNLLGSLGKSSGFSFNFGPNKSEADSSKSAAVVASPAKDEDQGDADQVELVDEEKLAFKPALPVLPDKVEVCTGEENEELIFCERAKLYRWDSSVWRERGVGELKLLRNPSNGSVRCLMRRDHVLKVCCNHPITASMILKPMSTTDGRAWTWWAIDFTEPSPEEDANKSVDQNSSVDIAGGRPETFAVRFKTVEHAQSFKDVFNDAVAKAEQRSKSNTSTQELTSKIQTVDLDGQNESSDSDEVCVVEKPPEVTEEQLSRARQLHLPDEFYSFENGCRSGEAEPVTEQEEAEEDALLEEAIRKGISARQQPIASGENGNDTADTTPEANAPATVSSHGDTAPTSTASPPQPLAGSHFLTPSGTTPSLFGSLTGTPFSSAFGGFSQSANKLLDFSSLSANLSSDSKPTWASPSVESTGTSSIWASATTPMFAGATKDHEGENGTEDSGEQDPHYEPIVSLPELVQTQSGEESELCLFFKRCRAYRFADNAWKERGTGNIKVLIQPQSVPEGCQLGSREVVPENVKLDVVDRARLLMRRDQVLKLCINQLIGSDVPSFKPMGNTGVCWVGEDYSEGSGVRETLAVRFKDESDLVNFKAAVARAQTLLKKD